MDRETLESCTADAYGLLERRVYVECGAWKHARANIDSDFSDRVYRAADED